MEITAAHYDKLQSGIKLLLEGVGRFVDTNGNYPQENSTAGGEIDDGEYSEQVQTVAPKGVYWLSQRAITLSLSLVSLSLHF